MRCGGYSGTGIGRLVYPSREADKNTAGQFVPPVALSPRQTAKQTAMEGPATTPAPASPGDKYDPAKLFSVPGLVAVVTGYPETSKSQLAAAAARIAHEIGHVNLVVANAGGTGPDLAGFLPVSPTDEKPSPAELQRHIFEHWGEDQFGRVLEVNAQAPFFTAVAFLDLLDRGNKAGNFPGVSSQVVVTASVGSYVRAVLGKGQIPYNASKAAVNHIFKMLGNLFLGYGIRANILNPGVFPSEISAKFVFDGKTFPSAFIPAGRFGDETDITGATLFLCSRAGAYLNGLSLLMDGGVLTMVPSTY
ncbi:hypothetical protein MAPG_09756 [Magnaporthiopsis poae ATCC 64411]|uniref:Short-chain dehydrogenase/reductase SDR n=1 Tax=Magnaporthiopsis poae (strain ATCC 64411 / 73-15) TaxID=644358 RepID=A0A0C4EAS7_MAGP6|nr:hypothetical protein MAPG_09756 [Magnaporthiopsis poae ATCC 64411]